MRYLIVLLSTLLVLVSAEDHYNRKFTPFFEHTRVRRATESSADVMARNLLEWIQGIYRQGARRTRQESNGYLPPYGGRGGLEKPRPFLPPSVQAPLPSFNEVKNYQPLNPNLGNEYSSDQPSSTYGTTLKPTYIPQGFSQSGIGSLSTSSSKSFTGSFSSSGFIGSSTTYVPPSETYGYPSSGYSNSGRSRPPSGRPSLGSQSTSASIPSSSAPTSSPRGYPTPSLTFQTPTGGNPSPVTGYLSPSTDSYGYPSPSPSPSFPTPTGNGRPTSSGGSSMTGITTERSPSSNTPEGSPIPESTPETAKDTSSPGTDSGTSDTVTNDDDLTHPPHIHELQVQCSKTTMTIDIEFNRQFDGVIYSKGFYMMSECRYVNENSGQTKYSFTVSLDSCGTEFINDFEGEAGQAYLENVLVIQNEPGIQEVWDTVRRVRCLWEGNINKALTVSLSVDMLNQEIVTFSGDTATAKLDIQVGKGPFAPAASGLVKIGEPMTLVVSVEGDPGFDLQVRDCIARDEPSLNVVQLTDERGCILKTKLFGAFQKTNDTGNTGASIIAYAFFQAFKFPDVMDLFIECNVELCKTNCETCPDENQQIDPGRRRREISYLPSNISYGAVSEPVRMKRGFRVIMPDDLSLASTQSLEILESTAIKNISIAKSICISYEGFYISLSLMLSFIVTSTVSAGIFYMKIQNITKDKFRD